VTSPKSCRADPKNDPTGWPCSRRGAPLAATMRRYLVQLTPSSRLAAWTWPTRHCASWPVAGGGDRRGGRVRHHPDPRRGLQGVAGRPAWRHRWPTLAKKPASAAAYDPDLFERLIEWDWPEAHHASTDPPRGHPTRPEPLPSSSLNEDAANVGRSQATACPLSAWWSRCCPGPACGHILLAGRSLGARRVHWLRIPVGKLRNDRMIPLHAELVRCWRSGRHANRVHIRRATKRLMADEHKPSTAAPSTADRGHHGQEGRHRPRPSHQLRHTLATQAINRGMRLRPSPRCSATGPWT